MNRFLSVGLGLVSILSAVAVKEYYTRRQFYLICLAIVQSTASYSLLCCFGVYLILCLALLITNLFFGLPLRPIEMEHLNGQLWFTISETFLVMTIFRDEFSAKYLFLFVGHLIVKVYHWISADRIDYMDQTPNLPAFFHVRIVSVMVTLFTFDTVVAYLIGNDIMHNGPSMMMLFGFEFSILAVIALSQIVKYAISAWLIHFYPHLTDDKSMYIFYLDLVTDLLKLILYVFFFWLILTNYGLPLHLFRDLFMTLRSFVQRLRDVLRYRMATANMNERYPEATQEELAATDRICIICREEMENSARKLPCGHLFHFQCLRSWLERQQVCPTCRRSVLPQVPDDNNTPNNNNNVNNNANVNPQNNANVNAQNNTLNNINNLENNNNNIPDNNPGNVDPNGRNGIDFALRFMLNNQNAQNNNANNNSSSNAHQVAEMFNRLMANTSHGLRLEPLIPLDGNNNLQNPALNTNSESASTSAPSNNLNTRRNVSRPLEELSVQQMTELEGELRENVRKRLEFLVNLQNSINSIHRQFDLYQQHAVHGVQLSNATPSSSSSAAAATLSDHHDRSEIKKGKLPASSNVEEDESGQS